MLGHKDSLGKFKKIKILSSTFSDHNAMRLEINYKKKSQLYGNEFEQALGAGDGQGSLDMLQSMGLRRVRHN